MYHSIEADVNSEVIEYQGPNRGIQLCIETCLTGLLSWCGEHGRAMLIVQGHSSRSNPFVLNSEYPNLVFLPDTSITLSSLQLGAMYESHAIYKTVLAHNVVEPCASIDIQSTNNIGDARKFLLKT